MDPGLAKKSPQEILEWAFKKYGNDLAIATSFGAEDVVLLDMTHKINPNAFIFTLDTGRLNRETYELMEKIRRKYGMRIKVFFPGREELEDLVERKGHYSFFESIENRVECCRIRKVEPLKRALKGKSAWVVGLRRDQSITRKEIPPVEEDPQSSGMAKISPLFNWTEKQVWDYIKKNDVPYNRLHDQGYPSIGCEPCTRAIKKGEDVRAGRWWWEDADKKECGLHSRKPSTAAGATASSASVPAKPTTKVTVKVESGISSAKPSKKADTKTTPELDAELDAHLDALENQSIYIIREAYKKFKDVGILWSIGKDSTVLLWLVRKAFFGRVPFPAIHCDTTYKFKEIIEYRDHYAKEWGLNLIVGKNVAELEKGMGPDKGKFVCCTALKTNALQQIIDKHKFKALFVGIRRDEEGSRGKERYFSPRGKDNKWNYKEQPPELWDQFKTDMAPDAHMRVHPLLHWNELDIWLYIKREKLPVLSLYFSKEGKRYRSVGCETCCAPCDSNARTIDEIITELRSTSVSERAGRAHDKEQAYMMQKLRSQGFM